MPKKKEFNKFRSEMPDAEWNGWVLAVTLSKNEKSG